VIAQSTAPFIAHVDSDDLVLSGAFQRMVTVLKSDSRIGQAHCYFFVFDENGNVTQEAMRARTNRFVKNRPPNMDYKRELLIQGTVVNHLRTYRRTVFDQVGYFSEDIRYGEDYEMGLRIIDKFAIKLVPEFLYGLRLHPNSMTKRSGYTGFHFLLQRLSICRRLSKTSQVSFFKEREYNLNKLMFQSFCSMLQDSLFNCYESLRGLRSGEAQSRNVRDLDINT
jgi:GT2 family glycosyltransferase